MQELIDQEKTLEAEITELESRSTLLENPVRDYDCNFAETHLQDFSDNNDMRSKKFKQMDYSTRVQHYPIEVLEVRTMHYLAVHSKLHFFWGKVNYSKLFLYKHEKTDESDMDGREDGSGMHNM